MLAEVIIAASASLAVDVSYVLRYKYGTMDT